MPKNTFYFFKKYTKLIVWETNKLQKIQIKSIKTKLPKY